MFDFIDVALMGVKSVVAERRAPAAALWSAIAAERRAVDERTARLRAMRLTLGFDELNETSSTDVQASSDVAYDDR